MEPSTKAKPSGGDGAVSLNIVYSEVGAASQRSGGSKGSGVGAEYEGLRAGDRWEVREAVGTPEVIAEIPNILIQPSAHRFVEAVAKVPGVRCVVIEDGEDGLTQHITTFVSSLSEETQDLIYEAEFQTIRGSPTINFEFHVRDATGIGTGTPSHAFRRYFFAVWGSLDANPE